MKVGDLVMTHNAEIWASSRQVGVITNTIKINGGGKLESSFSPSVTKSSGLVIVTGNENTVI